MARRTFLRSILGALTLTPFALPRLRWKRRAVCSCGRPDCNFMPASLPITARLTGVSADGAYEWQEVMPTPGGGWVDGTLFESAPGGWLAHENNGRIVPLGTRVVLRPSEMGWRFQG